MSIGRVTVGRSSYVCFERTEESVETAPWCWLGIPSVVAPKHKVAFDHLPHHLAGDELIEGPPSYYLDVCYSPGTQEDHLTRHSNICVLAASRAWVAVSQVDVDAKVTVICLPHGDVGQRWWPRW